MRKCSLCKEMTEEEYLYEEECEECGEDFNICYSCDDNFNFDETLCDECRGI